MSVGPLFRAVLLALISVCSGCASNRAATTEEPYDPIEPFNRVMYRVNDLGDRYILRPMAVGYERGLPTQIRGGVHNFFSNALYPVTIANDFLQGKFRDAARDGARFLVNTIIGLAGLFDPASRIGLAENDEDFGQTMGKWGVGAGPYLVIPIFGPSTVRDAVGDVVDAPLTPFFDITNGDIDWTLGAWVIYQVDRRSRFLDADQQVFESFDPYVFVRDAYLQNRRYHVADGDVPEEEDPYLENEVDDSDNAEPDPSGAADEKVAPEAEPAEDDSD